MLAKEVPVLEEEVKVFMEKLNNPVMHSDKTSVKEGIEAIESLRADVDRIKERGKTINEQQKFLDTEVTFFISISEGLDPYFKILSFLWHGMEEWD